MRLFAAVVPPQGALGELEDVVGRLRARVPGPRWTTRDSWHLTLAFYGEVPEATVPDLAARLGRAASRTGAFPFRVAGAGHFGGAFLWAGGSGDVHALRRLAERAQAAGRKAGLDLGEPRRYRPHLTLARSREPFEWGPLVAELEPFTGREWTVDELVLMRSELPRSGVPGEGPRYVKVGGWALRDAG